MICIECINLDLQSYQKHSACGFGKCKFEPTGSFVSITRDRQCNRFAKAATDVIEKRVEWADKTFGKAK